MGRIREWRLRGVAGPRNHLVIDKAGILDSSLLLATAGGLFIGSHTVHGNCSPLRLSRVAPVLNSASNSDHGIPLQRLLSPRTSRSEHHTPELQSPHHP